MLERSKAIAFDLDKDTMASLRGALPEWEIEVVNGATAASLSQNWNPGAADLLVVQAREQPAEALGLCRFLAFCGIFSADFGKEPVEPAGPHRQEQARRPDVPVVVLLAPGQNQLVRAALEAGADSCLVLPVQSKEMVSMLARVRRVNQPGRHTLNLDPAQYEDQWRDDGGQG